MQAWPTGWLYVGLLALGVVRGLGYYAVGRVATVRASPDGRVAAAQDRVRRWGARSVLFTYPVYGLSGATQVANGAAGVPLPHFLGVLTPVAAVWAGLQTLVGVAVWRAVLGT